MKEKPFYKWPIYIVRRKRWNPMRFIFGENYLSSDIEKWLGQMELNASDISFKETPKGMKDFLHRHYQR